MAEQDRPTGAPPPGPPRRFEHDLRDIREERSVPLEDVQQQTRIPVDILRRFEAGDLVHDPQYNEVYLRALLRSYAQAVQVSPQEALKAYEAAREGTYAGTLRQHYLGEAPPPPTEAPLTEPEAPPPAEPAPSAPAPGPPTPAPPEAETPPPAVAALARAPEPPAEAPLTGRPNEHFPKRRVPSAAEAMAGGVTLEKSWGLVIGGGLLGVVVIAAILWMLFRDAGPEPEVAARPVAADTTQAAPTAEGEPEPEAAETSPAPRLEMPIRVTVIARERPLEGFRVTQAPDVRRPYWLEAGLEQTFESEQEVTIWGTGSGESYGIPENMRLRMQGFEWDPPEGQVLRINAQTGQALLDSLHRVRESVGRGQ